MDDFKREIAGALKSTIDAHGPIDRDAIPSATKRIARAIRDEAKRERDRTLGTKARTRQALPPEAHSAVDRIRPQLAGAGETVTLDTNVVLVLLDELHVAYGLKDSEEPPS